MAAWLCDFVINPSNHNEIHQQPFYPEMMKATDFTIPTSPRATLSLTLDPLGSHKHCMASGIDIQGASRMNSNE